MSIEKTPGQFMNHFLERNRGFSMVEVMIVTAILAIIISLATPGYQQFSMRAHRTQAISNLLQAAGCQERLRAMQGNYDTAQCSPSPSDRYIYRFEPPARLTQNFSIIAQPAAAQSTDICGAVILNQDGQRTVGNALADVGRCWAGR